MQAYCMKCKAKREMKDAKSVTMKNSIITGNKYPEQVGRSSYSG